MSYANRLSTFLATLVLASAALTACDRERTVASPEDQTQADNTAAAPSSPAATGIDTPISADDIDLRYELVNGPTYDAASDMVSVVVRVRNMGKATLSSAGSKPVNLGFVLRDAEGKLEQPPAKQDFVRVPLPSTLAPGQSLEISMAFPAKPTFGGSVVLDAVQEGVSWFSWYGKPVLEFGSFIACEGNAASICQGGTPVPSKTP